MYQKYRWEINYCWWNLNFHWKILAIFKSYVNIENKFQIIKISMSFGYILLRNGFWLLQETSNKRSGFLQKTSSKIYSFWFLKEDFNEDVHFQITWVEISFKICYKITGCTNLSQALIYLHSLNVRLIYNF